MPALQDMRQAVREQRYRISSHASEEMSADDLTAQDVENIILAGQIAQRFTHDPRGTRYQVTGDTTDGRKRVCCVSLLALQGTVDHHGLRERKLEVMQMATFDSCEFCDGQIEQRVIQARFSFKGQTIYIDGVPAWVCTKCGEQYYDAPVYKQMEKIAQNSGHIKKTVCFPLAEYDMASAVSTIAA